MNQGGAQNVGDQRPAQQSPAQPQQNTLAVADLNRIVLEYLNKKGYTKTEAMLRMESSRTPTPQVGSNTGVQAGQMAARPGATPGSRPGTPYQYGTAQQQQQQQQQQRVEDPNLYVSAYSAVKDWTENSLDLYKPELRRILYPIFVHIFLELIARNHVTTAKDFFEENAEDHMTLHQHELRQLEAISLPSHVEENELAKMFRTKEYRVKVSRTTFDLLLYFLHENEGHGGAIIIRLLNQHIKTLVTSTRPGLNDSERVLDPDEGFPGLSGEQQLDAFNSSSVKLGRMPMDPDFQSEVQATLDQQDKDLGDEFRQRIKQEDTDAPTRELLPLPKYRPLDVDEEVRRIIDDKERITLSAKQSSLPSVCMYTFHNTHEELNSIAFSDDASLVAGGFADSFVKIWSLKGEPLESVLKGDEPSKCRRLIGHSGPVYGLSFAPDSKYLLSSSADETVRLWSLDTYTALVSYKGHNHPVWDVAFGPFGHYFATASHDQTARLWSCDHVYPLRIFAGHLSDVDTVTFHPNGMYVFTGSSDKTVRMWDVNKGSSVRVFIGHTGAVNALAVSPDGRWLATAGEDSIINVWDIGSGRRLKTMKGHGRASIYSLAFSREGSILVSAGADKSVRVWDVKKGTIDALSEPEPFTNGQAKSVDAPVADSDGRKKREIVATPDHLAVFHTKRTPVYKVQFTHRNLCLAGGAYLG
jgi:transcription initiation factor TFIID subunit 5